MPALYATLKEKPDGYTSRYYKVTVGKRYTVKERAGSCFVIRADDGEEVMVARERFTGVSSARFELPEIPNDDTADC